MFSNVNPFNYVLLITIVGFHSFEAGIADAFASFKWLKNTYTFKMYLLYLKSVDIYLINTFYSKFFYIYFLKY